MEMELRHAQKLEAVGRLAAGIAHEINTPIQFVGDNTRFMQDSFGQILEMIGKYEQIIDEGKHLPTSPERMAELDALGPMEFEPGEREAIDQAVGEMNRLSRAAMEKLADNQP